MSEFDLPLTSHMVAPVNVLAPGERLASAAAKLRELGISALPVVDSRRRLIGVLERTDLLRVGRLRARQEAGESRFWWPELSVAECMQTTVPVAPPERSLRECAQRMLERGLHRLYVLGDDELLGVLSTRELMRAVQRAQLAIPVAALAAQPAESISAHAPLAVACGRLGASPARALLVLVEDEPVGVFARAELRACLEVDPEQPTGPYADTSLLVLPAELDASGAAERALEARARYIVTREPEDGYRIISGLSFASCICGGAQGLPAEVEPLPRVAVPLAPPRVSSVPPPRDLRPAPAKSPLVQDRAAPGVATPGAAASGAATSGAATSGAGAEAALPERRPGQGPTAAAEPREPLPAGER